MKSLIRFLSNSSKASRKVQAVRAIVVGIPGYGDIRTFKLASLALLTMSVKLSVNCLQESLAGSAQL